MRCEGGKPAGYNSASDVEREKTGPQNGERPPTSSSDDRLESWKEIAAYLRRDVTTVQRWEKRERMPVHRHLHDRLGTVYAFRAELDEWLARRTAGSAAEPRDARQPDDTPASISDLGPRAVPVEPGRVIVARRRWLGVAWLVAAGVALGGISWGLWWRSQPRPDALDHARYHVVTDFDGTEQAAAVSPDGRLVSFVSDRDGQLDVWISELGSGQFQNLTRGRVRELVNPSVRTLGFTPDGALVTFWARGVQGAASNEIGVWTIPIAGGEPRPYLEGVAEFEWSRDRSRLVYHTPGPGDPTFIREAHPVGPDRLILSAPAGTHAHFPTWSLDGGFIYFVQGTLPDQLDLYRITPAGEQLERLTHHNAAVSHPVVHDANTIVYLVRDKDSLAARLYAFDIQQRASRSVDTGFERYTSLAASVAGDRLVATLASPKGTLLRVSPADVPGEPSRSTPLALPTGRGSSPRLGPGFLVYLARKGTSDTVWKLEEGTATELWSAPDDARIVGGPALDDRGTQIAVTIQQRGTTRLLALHTDGTPPRVITESLPLLGHPAWESGGRALLSAVSVSGAPQLVRLWLDGRHEPLVTQFASDPAASPDGQVIVYTGADIGTKLEVRAATGSGGDHAIRPITLSRGARRLRFVDEGRALVLMRGDIRHKDLWLVDLRTGVERQLTNLPPDFNIVDFDISADGRDIVVERLQEHSDIVMIDLSDR